jgi:hypothetical protein
MDQTRSGTRGHFVSFIGGILFVVFLYAIWLVLSYLALGVEIRSIAGYPTHHFARLYSRGGGGDQTYNLIVDGSWVYQSPDEAPGNQHESLFWDETGTVITLSNDDGIVYRYDAENKRERKE